MRIAIYSFLIILTIIGLGKTITHGEQVSPQREMGVVVDTHTYEDQNSHMHDLVYVRTEDGNVNLFDQSGLTKGDEVLVLLDSEGNYERLQRR